MKVGDKVKHINTGDYIYVIKKISDTIAVLQKPKELYTFISARLIIKESVCRINNLIKI